jgi:oligoendopeptidase F
MTIRQRELYGDNDKLKEIEKDWTIRSQRDIVAFRNRERDVQRNKDVEVLLTPEELPNIQNISTLSETSLKSFLSNVIKTANGRLNHLGMYRDVYLKDDDMGLRKETITGIPATSFDDINDLSTLLASHWCQQEHSED